MQAASRLLSGRERPALSDAKLAYFDGDFERCLEICANIRVSTVASASEVALITARAYLRSGRPHDAQSTLIAARGTHWTLDACLTSQMIEGTALIRQNDPDGGIALLLDAARESAGAHFAIRSEIAFCTALGYWAKREIDVAESFLERVDARADIIHARALELQAWCHSVRGNHRSAAQFFRLTLSRLDDCQASDRAITATVMSALAILAAELFDRDIADFIEARALTMIWPSALNAHRYLTLEHQALFAEFDGNTIKAYHLALQAHESAVTVPDDVFGWALKSSIVRNAGETYSAIVFAQRAQQRLATLTYRELSGEDRFSMLSVAQCCAHFDSATASRLFAAYRELSPLEPMYSSMSSDPRQAADETYIAGVIAQAREERDHAAACYREAFVAFRSIGYVRRAVIAANALLRLRADDDMQSYVRTELTGISNYITAGLTAPIVHNLGTAAPQPLMPSLTTAQREIVGLICLGKSNREIAALRHVGEQTIKNVLTKSVFPAFGVSSRAALVSICLRETRAGGGRLGRFESAARPTIPAS
jgi:DNA-binding CsgD family transcriptional regulator/tetratricopeptide (TPR) repeat protein